MSSLGFHPTIVERPRNKLEAIAAARAAFARCQFDEGGMQLGPVPASGVPEGAGRELRRLEGPAPAR
jgi:hypothetical protein